MKKTILLPGLLLLATAAHSKDTCQELVARIEAQLSAKGVQSFTLEIVPSEKVKDEKVIGTCANDTKKITYKRK